MIKYKNLIIFHNIIYNIVKVDTLSADNSDSSPETTKEIAVAIFVKLCPHYADDMPVYKLKPKLKVINMSCLQ